MISVMIPVYRAEDYLAACARSVLGQTERDLELILVDDGSPDRSGAICDELTAEDSRVRALHQPNGGVSRARNAALDAARGEYVCFVDADDWVEPDYLSYLLRIKRATGAAVSACNHIVEAPNTSAPHFPASDEVRVYTAREAMEHVLYHRLVDVTPCCKLYDRSLFEGLRYPEDKLFEDTYLFADWLVRSGGLAMGYQPKYHYRYNAESISKATFDRRNMQLLEAVDHMTEVALARWPELGTACTRRKVHAALSTRRFCVGGGDVAARDELDAIVRKLGPAVLKDRNAARRDKVAIAAICTSPRLYDTLWRGYQLLRRHY